GRSSGTSAVPAPVVPPAGRRRTLPGAPQASAAVRLAQWGTDRATLPRAAPRASGAGMGPGTNGSAGRRRRGKAPRRRRWRRPAWVPRAGAARPRPGTDRAARDRRLAARRGTTRAPVAVGPTRRRILEPVLRRGVPVAERGAEDCARRQPDPVVRASPRRLEKWGPA